jgi:hypothetical protein
MRKIKTRHLKLYPDDKTIQIYAILPQGTMGLMNLTPRSHRGQRYYENDVNGILFPTITKAKEYCQKNIDWLL